MSMENQLSSNIIYGFMVDLETFSTDSPAVTCQIGAVAFDRDYDVIDRFNVYVADESCLACGAEYCPRTIQLWQEQGGFVVKENPISLVSNLIKENEKLKQRVIDLQGHPDLVAVLKERRGCN